MNFEEKQKLVAKSKNNILLLWICLGILCILITGGLLRYTFWEDEFSQVLNTVREIKNEKLDVSILRKYNINVQSHESHGATPLIWCVFNRDIEGVKILLKARADISGQNRYGQTATDVAHILNDDNIYFLLTGKHISEISPHETKTYNPKE